MIHAAADEVQPGERQVHANRVPWLIAGGSAAALVAITVAMFGWPLSSEPEPFHEADTAVERTTASSANAEGTGTIVGQEPAPPEIVIQAAEQGAETSKPEIEAMVEFTIEQGWLDEQHALAWHGLAELWDDTSQADAIRTACDGASKTGFGCLRDVGNWSKIQRLGLPALLVLPSDPSRYLLLGGIGESQVQVGVGEQARWVPRRAVEERWLGSYLVPWPQAPGWPKEIRRGQSGEAVKIVMDMATRADSPWSGGSAFDEQFEDWLKGFQRRHGLDADGIVGPVTLLYLMAPTITQPRLASNHELTAQDS
jgi:general secretion pathway protein A